MASDNISGVKSSGLLSVLLFPGKVWQWFLYMGVGSVKGYGKVRAQTRLARSPIVTWILSLIAWPAIVFAIFAFIVEP